MRSRSFLFLGVVLFLAALSGVLFVYKHKIRWGLDIVGGSQITYQMVDEKGNAVEHPKAGDLDKVVQILTRRAGKELGVVDAQIQPKGENQVIVQLPGLTNLDEAVKTMGSSAEILFYDAKTVDNDVDPYRPYTVESADKLDVSFERKADHTEIKPYTPQYQDLINSWGTPIARGTDLVEAQMQGSPGGGYEPYMIFNSEAQQRWRNWSIANNTTGEKIAAVLDGVVISIAGIKKGAILDNMVTEGTFTTQYVHDLVDSLNSGALPESLKVLDKSQVDSTIGKGALNMIFTAGVIAASAIIVFMLVYYVFPGAIAVVALGLYILFTLTVLKLIDATFSLPAIAGFILSVGMAVDANILVFERLKEEMRAGKDLHRALGNWL